MIEKSIKCVLVMIFLVIILLSPLHAGARIEPIRAFFPFFLPQIISVEKYHSIIGSANAIGYNTIILGLSGSDNSAFQLDTACKIKFTGCGDDEIKNLINYCYKNGMQVVFSVEMIGRQSIYMKELQNKFPDILISGVGAKSPGNTVINTAFKFPDGKDIFEGAVFPMIDQLLLLYGSHTPEYFLLGIDEVHLGSMQAAAKLARKPIDIFFADNINIITGYLLEKGITPMIYGDMFLAKRLADSDCGIPGYTVDKRFGLYKSAVNADWHPWQGWPGGEIVSVITALNYMKDKDKISIIDWRYSTTETGEYPSIDYFKNIGFKEILPLTWFDENNMRDFIAYSMRQGNTGALVSPFPFIYAPTKQYDMERLLYNAMVYFKNPGYMPPNLELSFTLTDNVAGGSPATESRTGIINKKVGKLIFAGALKKNIFMKKPELLIRPYIARVFDSLAKEKSYGKSTEIRAPLTYDPATGGLTGAVEISEDYCALAPFFQTAVQFLLDNNYLYQVQQEHGFCIASELLPCAGPRVSKDYFTVDFSGLSGKQVATGLIIAPGTYGGIVNIMDIKGKSIPGGLLDLCTIGNCYSFPDTGLWPALLSFGAQINLEVFTTDAVSNKTPVVFSWGNYHQGFRVLVLGGRYTLQIAGASDDNRPLAITGRGQVDNNLWQKIKIVINRKREGRRKIVFAVDGMEESMEIKKELETPYMHG
ncbi:MAG TPA: hypothetical protein DC049_20085, partial [Spirochaetia bacterium]|nr:hypothetical protein [Spirochaetia bacterium]